MGGPVAGPLGNATYRRLFTAQVIALLGTGLTTIALALLAHDLAGDDAGAVLGTALALKMVAYVGLAPIVGALAHRLPRKALLVSLDLGRAALVLCLPFVDAVWQVYLLVFLVNACSAGFTPTFQATLPDVLPDEATYTKALTYSRLAQDLEALASPLIAGVALLVLSSSDLFVLNGLAFLASAALVAGLVLPRARAPERVGGWRANLSFGLVVFRRTPRLRGLALLNGTIAAASAMVIVNTVVVVRDHLGLGEGATALAYGCAGVGSMVLALPLPRLLDRLPERRVMLSGGLLLVVGLALAPLALGSLAALGAVWALLGAGLSLTQTPAGRLLRRSCADTDRPALFATQFALSHLCWLVLYPLAGRLPAWLGLEETFWAVAALAGVGLALSTLVWPREDRLVLEHEHPAQDHDHPHVHDGHHDHFHEDWVGPEPHVHPHHHPAVRHGHAFVIDGHHPLWPR
jgi:MFS family permease